MNVQYFFYLVTYQISRFNLRSLAKISKTVLLIIPGIYLFSLLGCNPKNHCYDCVSVDSVFVTGYPDSIKIKTLLQIDTISGKECFDKNVRTDTIFVTNSWQGQNNKIIYHKRSYICR